MDPKAWAVTWPQKQGQNYLAPKARAELLGPNTRSLKVSFGQLANSDVLFTAVKEIWVPNSQTLVCFLFLFLPLILMIYIYCM